MGASLVAVPAFGSFRMSNAEMQNDANGEIAEKHDAHDTRRRIYAIVASASGNLVEWYDFMSIPSGRFTSPRNFPLRGSDKPAAECSCNFRRWFSYAPHRWVGVWPCGR